MGIRLDWQIDDDEHREAVEEDPQIIAERTRLFERRRRFLIVVAVLIAVSALAAGIRLRQSNTARRAALQDIVSAETLALRLGDRQAFASAQIHNDEWRQTQNRALSRYQVLASRIEVTDEIIDINYHPHESEVHIRIMVDDHPAQLTWIYVYDNGWRHAASIDDPWEIRTRPAGHLEFSYYAVDQALVESLEHDLTGWLSAVCEADICNHLRRTGIRPRLGTDPTPEWRGEDQAAIIVPLLGGETGRPALRSDTRSLLYTKLAERWARDLLSEEQAAREPWMLEETTNWLLRAIDDTRAPTPVLDPLYAAFGPDMLADTFDAMHDGFSAQTAFRVAAHGKASPDLGDAELAQHLTLLLQVEAALPSNFPITWTDILFIDQEDLRDSTTTVDDFLERYNINQVDPHSLQVLSVQRHGRIVWAEVAYSLAPDPDPQTPLPTTYQPFTYDDGWVHLTRLRREERYLLRGDTITLLYGENDVDYVDDLLPYAEDIYRQVADDLGLDDPPPITFELTPYIPYTQSASYAVIYPRVASVYVNCCKPGIDPVTHLQQETAYAITREVLAYQLGERTTATALGQAMLFAEWRRLGLEVEPPPPPNMPTGPYPVEQALLDTLLIRRESGFVRSADSYGVDRARLISAELLLDVLHARYGDDMLPALVGSYESAHTVDGLLDQAFGITTADVESDWFVALAYYLAPP